MSTGSIAISPPPSSVAAIDRGVLPTTEVVARVHRIQEVMKALMKDGVHFGTIPGTPKPTLYKPGAELLLMTFRIAATPANIEDLSTPDEVRYRVTMRGTNQMTGEVIGEMVGECSSSEEKYRWRKPVCQEEFNEADPMQRRQKWQRADGGAKKIGQIRTSPADVANTVLKMAVKRAFVALALSSLGASDIFSQDLEDLTEELRESVAGHDTPRTERKEPQRKSSAAPAAAKAKPLPADAKTVVGLVEVVNRPAGKKFSVIKIKGDRREFNAWNDTGAQVITDAQQFEGTDHLVSLAYTEQVKGDKTYFNPVSIEIADEPKAHAKTEARAGADTAGPAGQVDIGKVSPFDREAGQEG